MKIEEAIQQKVFKHEGEKLLINIMYTASWLSAKQGRFFKQFGISAQQYNVLRILNGQKGKSISVALIHKKMVDKNSNTSRIIDKLVEKKLVQRKQNRADRRQVDVKISIGGKELLIEIQPKLEQELTIFESLTPTEKQRTNQLLDKLRKTNKNK